MVMTAPAAASAGVGTGSRTYICIGTGGGRGGIHFGGKGGEKFLQFLRSAMGTLHFRSGTAYECFKFLITFFAYKFVNRHFTPCFPVTVFACTISLFILYHVQSYFSNEEFYFYIK